MKKILFFALTTALLISILKCSKDGGIVLLSVDQEIQLGEQTDSAIKADPEEFPILARTGNEYVYNYFESMLNSILSSDEINYKDEFDWSITIINKDVMNAFAVPGGKIYFYTGLIKYLENSSQIAGVLAHECAHVDKRHSNKQLTKAYGVSFLISLLVGDNSSQLQQIAGDLATGAISLQFSRTHEYEADEYSIKYLMDTDYYPKGIEGFFLKLKTDGHTSETFEFLSTHPSDDNRLENINKIWQENGSPSGDLFLSEYNQLISNLP